MGAIKLPHSGGGSMSIGAPDTNPSGDLTLTLPSTIGSDGQVLGVDGSGNLSFVYPSGYGYFRVKMNGDQTITEGTEEIIEFDVEQYDSKSWWNTSTYKYTPQVAGIYFFNLQLFWGNVDTHKIKTRARIYKNTELWSEDYGGVDDVYGHYSHNTTAIIGLNGSSDYVKFQAYGHNDDNSNPSLVGDSNYGQYTSAFGYLLEAT